MQLELEVLTKERMQRWEAEMAMRAKVARLPRTPPRWQRWLGLGLVWGGAWLTRWGAALTLRPYGEDGYSPELPPVRQ